VHEPDRVANRRSVSRPCRINPVARIVLPGLFGYRAEESVRQLISGTRMIETKRCFQTRTGRSGALRPGCHRPIDLSFRLDPAPFRCRPPGGKSFGCRLCRAFGHAPCVAFRLIGARDGRVERLVAPDVTESRTDFPPRVLRPSRALRPGRRTRRARGSRS
jgi:hypothetical protein